MVSSSLPVVPGSLTGVRHYYHLYADPAGRWRSILRRHLHAMDLSGLEWDLVVGVVGPEEIVQEVALQLPLGTRIVCWPDGFEQRTLNLIHDDIQAGLEGPVLYAHSKGAGFPQPYSNAWRHCMTRIVRDAKVCLDLLAEGADAIGSHWLTAEEWPGRGIDPPFYGGNFWWTTSEHLRQLDRPSEGDRFGAERWLTSVMPKNPVNLVSGWPGGDCHKHT